MENETTAQRRQKQQTYIKQEELHSSQESGRNDQQDTRLQCDCTTRDIICKRLMSSPEKKNTKTK